MKYKVHRLEVNSKNMQQSLEYFIGLLQGEIISIIPNVKPVFMPLGGSAKVDFLLVIEKLNEI